MFHDNVSVADIYILYYILIFSYILVYMPIVSIWTIGIFIHTCFHKNILDMLSMRFLYTQLHDYIIIFHFLLSLTHTFSSLVVCIAMIFFLNLNTNEKKVWNERKIIPHYILCIHELCSIFNFINQNWNDILLSKSHRHTHTHNSKMCAWLRRRKKKKSVTLWRS